MEYDLWFSRYEDGLFYALAKPGQEPTGRARRVASVQAAYQTVRYNEPKIIVKQVGIVPPEMLGLE